MTEKLGRERERNREAGQCMLLNPPPAMFLDAAGRAPAQFAALLAKNIREYFLRRARVSKKNLRRHFLNELRTVIFTARFNAARPKIKAQSICARSHARAPARSLTDFL